MRKNNWTEVKIFEEALQFSTRTEWLERSPSSYMAAKRKKILKKIADSLFPKRMSTPVKWTKESVTSDARRYTTISQWREKGSLGAYKAARRYGWLELATSHMNKRNKWTAESVLEDAKKYENFKEWRTQSHSAYSVALKLGLVKEATSHMEKPVQKIKKPKIKKTKKAAYPVKWTKELLIRIAKTMRTKEEWRRKSPQSLQAVYRLGLMSELEPLLLDYQPPFVWTEEMITEEVKKFKSRSEWKRKSPSSYSAAFRKHKGQLNLDHLMSPKTLVVGKDQVAKDALKYKTASEWKRKSSNYNIASRRGWLEEVTGHMKKMGGTSSPEQEILKIVKNHFPKAHTARFSTKKDERFKPATQFELDIYIPELRKGIEFNGEYWHSFEGLKRGRPTWSDEDIAKYHDIKSSFFKDKNIEVCVVKEKEWKKDQSACIDKICQFVGIK